MARTGSQDVQVVMDWMLANEEEPAVAEPNPMAQPEPQGAPAPVPKSIRCDDCGKLFSSNEEVEFHASKSGKYPMVSESYTIVIHTHQGMGTSPSPRRRRSRSVRRRRKSNWRK